MDPRNRRRSTDADLLGDVKFVKLTAVHDLPRAEMLRKILRDSKVGAVIINDEHYQARPDAERADAKPEGGAFRIEVPEPVIELAREVLEAIEHAEEE